MMTDISGYFDARSVGDEPVELNNRPFAEVTVHWNPRTTAVYGSPLGLKPGDEQEVVLYAESRRLLGIDWWTEREVFDARVHSLAWDAETGDCDMTCAAISPFRGRRAEWWRRWGYAIVRRLPYRRGAF